MAGRKECCLHGQELDSRSVPGTPAAVVDVTVPGRRSAWEEVESVQRFGRRERAFCDGARDGMRSRDTGKKITTRQVTHTVSVETEAQLRVSCTRVELYALVDHSDLGSVRAGSDVPTTRSAVFMFANPQ